MTPSIEEHLDIIVRVEPYFEDSDTTNRIMVEFIDVKNRICIKGSTEELRGLVDFLNEQIERANKIKYLD